MSCYGSATLVGMSLLALVIFDLSATAFADESLAARVVGRKRYAQTQEASQGINPDAVAGNAAPMTTTLPPPPPPSGDSSNPPPAPYPTKAVMEEDLLSPSSSPKKEIKAPSELPREPISTRQDPPLPLHNTGKQLPPEAWDPRKTPPPPPGSDEMNPASNGGRRRHAADIDDDGGIGVSLGIGFGSRSFSGSLGLTFPIYRWLAWGVSGSYETWADDEDKETLYGPEGSLILRIPTRVPITPFGGVGVGYSMWTRSTSDVEFDENSSLLSLYFLGISIPMAEHLALNMSQTWKTYLGTPPRRFDDKTKYEPYGMKQFDVGLSVVF